MAYYAIGIGGTGAKCIESLIHLAAAGMMPDSDELHVLFVDPDAENGSRTRSQDTLTHYVECKDKLDLGQTKLLQTKIVSVNPNAWTPFKVKDPKLKVFFGYDNFPRTPTGNLFDILYSDLEKDSTLQEGFGGHPSIGSAALAKTIDLQSDNTWSQFSERIKADDGKAKVFLFASIFGGTGASGFPTIARIINDNLRVKLGGALLLPYFKFIDDRDDSKLKARSNDFFMNTQAALNYYHLLDQTNIYEAVYLFGDEHRVEVKNNPGGGKQKNAPHFIELYGALSAIDFFGKDDAPQDGKDDAPQDGTQYFVVGREKNNELQWTDLPNSDVVRLRIGQLTRFALAFLSVYRPALKKVVNRNSYRASWYVDFFERGNISIDQALLITVEKYCEDFLRWIANIQNNHSNQETVKLIEYSGYAEVNDDDEIELKSLENFSNDWSNLIQSQTKTESKREAESNMLDKIWKRMCSSRTKESDAKDIGKFLRALYENCRE